MRVEGPERLIHQENVRVNRQGAGQPHPLLHSAGKLIGKVVLELPQADHIDVVIDPLLDSALVIFWT